MAIPAAAVGAYADLGGEVIVIEWAKGYHGPEAVSQALMNVAGYLDDVEKPLLAAAAISRADMRRHFDTETAPDGSHWAELDPEYATRKASEGWPDSILVRTSDLRDSAVNSFSVEGHAVFFSTAGLPFYWEWHEEGVGTDNVGFARDHRERVKMGLYASDSGGAHEALGVGRGRALPARPFIGLSDEAEAEIFDVFDLWFSEASNIFIGGTGVVQERGPGGRFGRKLF